MLAGAVWIAANQQRPSSPKKQPSLSYQCFKTDKGWGYDILVEDKVFIHQPMIPKMPGTAGFATEQQARQVAEIVIGNIKLGQRPTITREQLQRVGIFSAQ